MKKIVIVLVVLVVALAVFVGYGFMDKTSNIKLGYVNNSTLYNDFKLKKELEAKYTKTEIARKGILDSLMLQFQVLSKNAEKTKETDERLVFIREQYLQKKQQFDEDNNALARQYTAQVWEQLNQYIKDYGKQHQYKFIFGANGEGSIMYAAESDDLSKDLTKYVNQRYEGKVD